MSDEEWEKKATGGGKVATLRVADDTGEFECGVIIRGIAKGHDVPAYKIAGAMNHAKREIGHNKLIARLQQKLLKKKIIAAEKGWAAGGAGGGGK